MLFAQFPRRVAGERVAQTVRRDRQMPSSCATRFPTIDADNHCPYTAPIHRSTLSTVPVRRLSGTQKCALCCVWCTVAPEHCGSPRCTGTTLSGMQERPRYPCAPAYENPRVRRSIATGKRSMTNDDQPAADLAGRVQRVRAWSAQATSSCCIRPVPATLGTFRYHAAFTA